MKIFLLFFLLTGTLRAQKLDLVNEPKLEKLLKEQFDTPGQKAKMIFSVKVKERSFGAWFYEVVNSKGVRESGEFVVVDLLPAQPKVIWRDVSLYGIRENREIFKLNLQESEALLSKYAEFMIQMLGRVQFENIARERLKQGKIESDERWVFQQILGLK